MGVGFVRLYTPLHAPDEYFDMYPIDEIELDKWIDGDELDTFWKENFQGNLSLEGDVKQFTDTEEEILKVHCY